MLPSFNTQEHVIYIEGNEDKVRADDSMTRAEASKMIYTLLVDPLPGDGTSFPGRARQLLVRDVCELHGGHGTHQRLR